MREKKRKVFWIRLKPFEPDFKNARFKPTVLKGLVYAHNAKDAEKAAYDQHISFVKALFPTADLKVIECKNMSADFSITV